MPRNTQNRGTFETERDHSIRAYHVYGKTVKARLYEDDTQDRYFHLYFNPSKHAAERERLELTLDRFKIYMDKHIGDVVPHQRHVRSILPLSMTKLVILSATASEKMS